MNLPMNVPLTHGRFIDERIGSLAGEAAEQVPGITLEHALVRPSERLPTSYYTDPEGPTYYGQPVLQKPVWIWTVPVYFYTGGTAGAALTLAAAVQAFGGKRMSALVERSRWIGTAGLLGGALLLIADLGRPLRFLNMLRVFRPTSALNVGSWLLTASGPFAGMAAMSSIIPRMEWLARPATYLAGLTGPGLAGYTGVVIANTAVPAWQEARREWPALFVASAVTGAASLLDLFELTARERRALRTFGFLGRAAEAVTALAVERKIGRTTKAAQAFETGRAAKLWRAAKLLGLASLATMLAPGVSRKKRTVSALLGTASALCVRFAAIDIGKESAREPLALAEQHRKGRGAFETTGLAAVAGPGDQRAFQPPPKRIPAAWAAEPRAGRPGFAPAE